MAPFATYLHPQTCFTSKPIKEITFSGHSLLYFSQVQRELAKTMTDYPSLSVRQAEIADYGRVHTLEYLYKLQQLAAGQRLDDPPRLGNGCLGLECALPGHQYGLGGLFQAIDEMKKGNLERAYCFTLGSHHAFADWGHGYCFLHTPATAARYAQEQGFAKVLIVDWDLHHGDGTQAIFANDPTVYCISIHSLADLYMAVEGNMRDATTTAAETVGHCNIPVLHQLYSDEAWAQMGLPGQYYRGYEAIPTLATTLEQLPWQPDLIILISGYDSHKDDQGAGITDWTNEDFRHLTGLVLDVAKRSGCPLLSTHAGGYTLPIAIAAAKSHVELLANK